MPVRMPCCRRFMIEPSVPSAYAIPPPSNKTPTLSPAITQVHTARSHQLPRKAAASEQPRRTIFGRPHADREARTHRKICFSEPKIKNPQGLDKTLRIAPASHPRLFPRPRGNDGQFSGQVFWLMVLPTPRAFPSLKSDSGVNGFRPHSQRRDREGFAPSSLTRKL